MCKAFRCEVCNEYYDGDPNTQHVWGFGIIWSPERGVEKNPSKWQDMCEECSKAYSQFFSKFRELMQEKRSKQNATNEP